MAVRRLLLLPFLIILLVYIGKLVAVVERQTLPQSKLMPPHEELTI